MNHNFYTCFCLSSVPQVLKVGKWHICILLCSCSILNSLEIVAKRPPSNLLHCKYSRSRTTKMLLDSIVRGKITIMLKIKKFSKS